MMVIGSPDVRLAKGELATPNEMPSLIITDYIGIYYRRQQEA
jgi:hypothetical protein